MNRRKYLRLSMLELSKTLMCELWYDYVIPKYGKKAIAFIKIDDIYKDIAENVETRFDTLNDELERAHQKGKIKK